MINSHAVFVYDLTREEAQVLAVITKLTASHVPFISQSLKIAEVIKLAAKG